MERSVPVPYWRAPVSARGGAGTLESRVQILGDDDLLRRCAAGDERALEELVRRYQGALYRFLLRMMNSPEDAEDAAMEVFVRAWKNAASFQHRSKVATWLYRIALNIARDAHSRKQVRPKEVPMDSGEAQRLAVGSAETDALSRVETDAQMAALKRGLEELNPSDRALLLLYYVEQKDYTDIQQITGLSYPVLKTRLARARMRLRKRLEAEMVEADR
ncbi:MAG: RNA polymerase sigma factor [Chthonomonadales bacterium]